MGAQDKLVAVSKAELDHSDFIPQSNQVTKNTIKLTDGSFMQVIKLQGVAHESADPRHINIWHNQLNGFLKDIASPHCAVWTHQVRREFSEYPGGEFEPGFCRDLNEKYREHMASEAMLVNELYITFIYRPEPTKLFKLADIFSSKKPSELRQQQLDNIYKLDELVGKAMAALDKYDPVLLGSYTHNGFLYSEVAEFLAYLINGEWRRFPVPKSELRHTLVTSRPFFGKGGEMALKAPTTTYYCAAIYIQDYPDETYPGLLNGLLGLPCEFVLSQSLTFLSKQAALGRMKRQQARMVNAGDVAESQIVDIDEALDALVSNKYVMGTHHHALLIKATDQDALKELVNLAGTVLSEAGMKWAMEDDGLAGAFWSMLPGNYKMRTRVADITSRNFAGFASFHNYPIGHLKHNQWGDAVAMFKTQSGAPYYFNFHRGEEGSEAKRAATLDPNHKDLANTIVIGKSGTGKTVLELFLLANLQKFTELGKKRLTCVVFDKDLGASIGVRAMGGKYYPLKNGQPSGFNPLQLPPNPKNIMFVEKLLTHLCKRDGFPLSPKELRELNKAIAGVMTEHVPMEQRRLSSILEFLNPTLEDGLYIRLERWCGNGELAWLFDNDVDTLDLDDCNIIGFDVTDFLDNPETRTPTIMYLFHRIEGMIDGRRIPIFMDEFWKLLDDPAFEELAKDKLVTIRKQDGFLVMFTQAAKQVLQSPIAFAIIQQTATKIFLPNPEADYKDYVDGFKCTESEFEIVKNLGEKSRKFLIKQGGSSVVAELNLRGFDDELAVLSGNTATSNLVERLVQKMGSDPKLWLPEFHKIRKGE